MRNIKDVTDCLKCGGSDYETRYDPVDDKIVVDCYECGYKERVECADKAEPDFMAT